MSLKKCHSPSKILKDLLVKQKMINSALFTEYSQRSLCFNCILAKCLEAFDRLNIIIPK